MSMLVRTAIAVSIALTILPVLMMRAQAEGEAEPRPVEVAETTPAAQEPEVATSEPSVAAEGEASEQSAMAASEGEMLGATTTDETAESDSTDASASSSEPASSGDEDAPPAMSTETAAAAIAEFFTIDTASSTASSTPPVADVPAEEPKEEPLVLQPAVTLHVSGNSIEADIELENLTCKSCDKALPAAQVKAYYTAWYPNDGPELKEVGERVAEQNLEVSDVALWASRSMTWSATDIAQGRYYFVIVVDPENAIGAYRMQRMEFAI
jgi:hypothetical protein